MKLMLNTAILLIFSFCCSSQQNTAVNDQSYKDALITIGKRCYDRGLFWGTGGDISVRVSNTDRFVIKSSMTCVGDLDYQKVSTVNFKNELIEGPKPSHETAIHAKLYQMRESVGAILHMHSPFATAWGCVGETIPAITQQSVTFLKEMGIVPYYPVGSDELITAIVKAYENPATQVVLMENHGTFVVGKDLYDLLYNAEKVENTAKIAYLGKALGIPKNFEPVVAY